MSYHLPDTVSPCLTTAPPSLFWVIIPLPIQVPLTIRGRKWLPWRAIRDPCCVFYADTLGTGISLLGHHSPASESLECSLQIYPALSAYKNWQHHHQTLDAVMPGASSPSAAPTIKSVVCSFCTLLLSRFVHRLSSHKPNPCRSFYLLVIDLPYFISS